VFRLLPTALVAVLVLLAGLLAAPAARAGTPLELKSSQTISKAKKPNLPKPDPLVANGHPRKIGGSSRRTVAKSSLLESPDVNPLLARESSADLVADTADDARQLAFTSGERVLVLSALTGSTTTYANPDGSYSYLTHDGLIRTRTAGGGWAAINTSLQPGNGGRVAAAGNVGDVTFSGGGADRLLATDTPTGSQDPVQLLWPTDLPTGVTVGDTTSYPQVRPGIDLIERALPEGFEFSMRLLTRPTGPVSFTLPLQLPTGWTAEQTGDKVLLRSSSGEVAGSVSRTHAFGARLDPLTGDLGPTSDSTTRLLQTADGPALSVEPDPAFLADATTVYPVTLDPQISFDDSFDTYVDQKNPTLSFATSTDLHVGAYASSGTWIKRSFLNFDTSQLASISSASIVSASIGIVPESVSSCTNFTVEVWNTNALANSSTTWNNRPVMPTHYSNITLQNDGSPCSTPTQTTADVTSLVKSWSGSSNAIGLKVTDETSTSTFAKFYGSRSSQQHPYLGVIYNGPPLPPVSVTASSATNQCTIRWYQSGSNSYPTSDYWHVEEWLSGTHTRSSGNISVPAPPAPQQSYTFTNLSPSSAYTYYVYEHNNPYGDSDPAPTNGITCQPGGTVPTAPQNVTASPGDTSVSAVWAAPANDGTTAQVTGYTVQLQTAAGTNVGSAVSIPASQRAYTFDGGHPPVPTNGSSYRVAVTALSSAGNSPAGISNTVTPAGAPSAPTLTSVAEGAGPHAGTTDVLAHFTVNGNGGAAIDYCRADATDGASRTFSGYGYGPDCSAGTIDITGLAYATSYTVKVYAHNAGGFSGTSNTVSLTTGQDGTITKALTSGSTVTVGGTLSYQIAVTAPSSNPLIVNTIVDVLPAGLSAAAAPAVLVNGSSCSATGFTCAGGSVTDATGALVSQVQINSVNSSPSGYALPAGQSVTFTVPVVYTGGGTGVGGIGVQGRACRTLANTAKLYDNYAGTAGNAPQASSVVNATGCGAGLGLEPWWSYLRQNVGVASDASVNVANGNLVVTATDGTPIQGRGHLAQVTRRAYNSQDTTLETLPGSIGKGWQLNLGMSDALADTGVTGTALRIPTVADAAALVTGPLGITLVDRDGTRHTFTPRLLSLSGATGAFTGTALSLATLPTALGTVTPQALSVPTGRVGCVDVAYDPPAGVHLALWRYVAVVSSNSSCDRATWTQSGTNAPIALGYAAIRPDRLRTEYDSNGLLLAMTDPSGVSLRYGWNNLNQLTSVTEAPCSSNCRSTTFTYTASNGSPATSNADLSSLATALGRTVTVNDIASMTITDPALRTTTYTFTTSTLGGAYPAGVRLLSTVVNDSGTGGAHDQVSYGYQSDGTGANCSATPGQLCTITDERGNPTSFGYDAGTGTAPLLGPARIANIHDRRRDSHTGGGYGTLLAYSDRTSSPGSGTTVTMPASGNGATPANSNREAFYGNIDATGRVGQLLEGPQPISTSTALRNTVYAWDSDSSHCGVSHIDNDLCGLTRIGSAAPSGSDGAATPDEVTNWRYDDAGKVLQTSQTLTPTTSLVTTHGYTRQWGYADGTTSSSAESDAPNSSTATAPNSLLALYTLADLTSTVSPRGNATAAAQASSYRTSYVVDNLTGAAPATTPAGQTCGSSGTPTGNTGLLCAASAPYTGSSGPSLAVTKNTYDSYGELTSRMDPNVHATIYDYYGDGATDMSGTTGAAGWLKTITDPTGAFVAFGYDAAGNVIRSWDRTATSDAGLGTSGYPGNTGYLPTGNQGVVPHSDTRHGPGSFAAAAAHPWRWVLASSDNLGNTTTLTRDAAGNVTSSTTARGNTTVMSYDEDNDLLSVLTPTNAALTPPAYQLFSYDAFGSQVSSTDPAFAQTYSATPSEAGRTSNVSSRSYYDAVGRRTDTYTVRQTGTSSSGPAPCVNTISIGDPLLPASAVVCVTSGRYDSVDNTVWTRDASGQATSRSYDAAHRLVQVISPAVNSSIVAGANTSRPQTGYVYDADSNPTTVCRPRQYSEYGGACSDTATGDVVHTTYDARNMATSTSSYRAVAGAALTSSVGYDPAGNVLSSTDRNGHVTSYSYDVLNRRVTATVPRTSSSSTTTDWIYDPSGSVLAVAEPGPAGSTPGSNIDDRRLTASTLDADHRVVDTVHALQTSLPDGPSSSSSANRAQLRAAMSTALATGTSNTRSRQVYDADGNIVASYTARAFTSGVASATDRSDTVNNSNAPGGFSSGFMTRTDLDADNRPVAVYQARSDSTSTDPLAGSLTGNEAAQCAGTGPTMAGLPHYPTGSRVCVTTTSYDPDNRPVTVTLPTATASRNGRQITDTYSVDGLLLTSAAPAPSDTTTSGSTPSATATTSSSYDGAGRAVTSVDALGLVTATSYSPAGSVVRLDPPTGPNGLNHWTAYSYTLDGQQVWTVTPRSTSGHPTGTPDEIDTEVRGYTADGLLKDLSQPGTTTSDTRHTSYSYDNNGNTTAVKAPSASALDPNNTVGAATTMTYTRDNLLLAVTTPINPDGSKSRTVSHGYDPAGRETSTTTSVTTTGTTGSTTTGTVSASGYATNDRLLTEHVAAADTHSADSRAYSYDADGNRTCAISNTGSTTAGAAAPGTGTCSSPLATASAVTSTFYLDGLTRTVSERHPSGAQRTTSYSYDGNGAPIAWRQDTASGPATSTVTQNDAGYPISQTGTLLGSTPTSWSFNSNGQPLRQANSNGTLQQWAYNSSDDTLLATGLSSPGRTDSNLAHYQYTYDEQGRILTAEHKGTNPDGGTILPVTYGYAYDAAGRATYFNNAGVVTNSSYDHDSNRITNGTTTYTYNADDSIATIKTTKATDTGKTQAYDVEGNLTDDGCTTTAYTGFDQTRTITPKAGASTLDASCGTSTLNYGYDPLGRQINRATSAAGAAIGQTNTTATDVYYTGTSTHVLGETTSSDTTVTLPTQTATHSSSTIDYTGSASGTDLAVTSTGSDNTTQYLFDDGTGSIGAVSTSSGGTACVLHYTPAGEAVDDYATTPHQASANPCSVGSTHDDKQYRGERRDNTSGTYQLGARTYTPGRAGFTTSDSASSPSVGAAGIAQVDPLTANTYSYVNGDPVNAVDPDGHKTEDKYYGRKQSANLEASKCDQACHAVQIKFVRDQARADAHAYALYTHGSPVDPVACYAQRYNSPGDQLLCWSLTTNGQSQIDQIAQGVDALDKLVRGAGGACLLDLVGDEGSKIKDCSTDAVMTLGPGEAARVFRGLKALRELRAARAAEDGVGALSGATQANVDNAIERAAAGKVRFPGHDGKPYLNSDGLLPEGEYTEWTAAEAGAKRGADRVIIEGDPANPSAIYYWDHVNPPVRIR
jgi:RHS repeat-associated protein